MSHRLVLLVCLPQLVTAPAQPEALQGVYIRLTEILEQKLLRMDEALLSAEEMLRQEKSVEEALGLIEEARRQREEALRVCAFILSVASKDVKWASSLSVVRLRTLEQRPPGTIRVYDPKTNTFGSYAADGGTRTFYKPDPAVHKYKSNLDYWNAQPGSSPSKP
jgi:hypothetical protein